jgi:hypothetical protein
MANTNKTKAEILQELESIKGLLLEEDDIPILQDMEDEDEILDEEFHPEPPLLTQQQSVLPGQASLFGETTARFGETTAREESASTLTKIAYQLHQTTISPDPVTTPIAEVKSTGFASHLANTAAYQQPRPLAKASGENPFLPQHIRERLHGNNPPPLFEYETAKKIISSTKNIAHKTNKPRQYLVEEVMLSMMPQIERELRHRLFAMSVDDLEKLLNEDEE